LIGINKKQVLDLGISQNNIFDSGACTSCSNSEFFSYRREGEVCGRIISVAMLKRKK
jgi:copper oxidase (laccase) domain-containing protein